MFERFTTQAREAVVGAQAVARQLRSGQIDTRHLLVSLVEESGPVSDALRTAGLDPDDIARRGRAAVAQDDALDADALASLGIDLDVFRARTDKVFGEGALDDVDRRGAPKGHVPFTPDAKKALELSLREAIRLHEKGIDSRHLMLGILRADSPGGRILADAARAAGLDVAALRLAMERDTAAA